MKELCKLYLLSNKIHKIENLEFEKVILLELGANKIETIENLDKLPSLN